MGYCGKVNSIPARAGTILLANIVRIAILNTFVFTESIKMSFEVYTHHLKVPFMRCVKLMELTERKSTVGEIVMGSLHTQ